MHTSEMKTAALCEWILDSALTTQEKAREDTGFQEAATGFPEPVGKEEQGGARRGKEAQTDDPSQDLPCAREQRTQGC